MSGAGLGRLDGIPVDSDLVRRAARADCEHGRIRGVPAPGFGKPDAACLLPAERGEHKLGLSVGMRWQYHGARFPADGMRRVAARHLRLAGREGLKPHRCYLRYCAAPSTVAW